MKATLMLMALLVAVARADNFGEFIGGVYDKGGFYADCGGGIAVGPNGAIVKCGDTYLTPSGVYVNAGGTYLGPNGSVAVKVGQDFVGTSGFTARSGDMYLNPSFVSIGYDRASFIKFVLK